MLPNRLISLLLLLLVATPLLGEELPPGALVRLGATKFRFGVVGQGAALTADGKNLLVGGNDGAIHEWDLTTGQERRKWAIGVPVRQIRLSGDGKKVASAGFDSRISVWETATANKPTLISERGVSGPE